jgi:hypothetical protein
VQTGLIIARDEPKEAKTAKTDKNLRSAFGEATEMALP